MYIVPFIYYNVKIFEYFDTEAIGTKRMTGMMPALIKNGFIH